MKLFNKLRVKMTKTNKTEKKNSDIEKAFQGSQVLNVLADWAADRAGGVKKGRDYLEIGTDVYAKTLLIRGWIR